MSEHHSTSVELPDIRSLTLPYDLTGHIICRKCTARYVRPGDYYKKGEKNLKCEFCRGRVKKSDFPTQLLVSKAVQEENLAKATEEDQWLATLSKEEESLLVHPDKVILGLSAATIPFDLPRATSDVHWDDVQERLRDLYSLERLFKGMESIQTEYNIEANTIAPIGLLVVALNNCAVRSVLPYKLCWLHTGFGKGSATIFLAFGAWLPAEVEWWVSASPERRLKACSAWESSIRQRSNTIAVPKNVAKIQEILQGCDIICSKVN
ncbi:hypothetical protein J3E74DRAFT_293418 [Bipolaris maydis]|nr:hypothetical protein J3E74DRAFT_293418 [Bipolaris maydis]